MAVPVAVVGTSSTHGGQMITATGTTNIAKEGPVCLEGDLHSCPIHGVTPIVSNLTQYVTTNGKPVAIQGSVAGCGAVLNGSFATNLLFT